MHVAIVRRHFSLKKAGAEKYCVSLTRQLQKLGQTVTIVGESIDDELRDEVEFLPVEVAHSSSWAKNRSFADNCAKALHGRRFDVVHGLSRTPHVDSFRLTDPLQRHWVDVYYRNPLFRWLQHRNPRHRCLFDIERQIYQPGGVRRIIVQSHLDAQLLARYYHVPADRLRRIPNGVDTAVYHPGVRAERHAVRTELGIAPDVPLLIFAGMDFRRKGLDSLLRTLARLDRRDAQLLVLGDGQIAKYQRLAESLGLGQRVCFAGRRSGMQRYYGAGDLFVLPTIYEPCPNVNLEALACGLPVLTTATAGGADAVEDGWNGYLVRDAWALDEMVAKIDRHLGLDVTERTVMALRCRESVEGQTVEANARATLAVLEEVARDKSRV